MVHAHQNLVSRSLWSMNVVFQRLEFAIQKELAMQLVAGLPFINV
jgi:hypothetical protein